VINSVLIPNDILELSATRLAKAIRAGEVSSAEAVNSYLNRIDEVNRALNAVVQVRAERALAEAREADEALARDQLKGSLHGVPFTVKDAIETQGLVCAAGTTGRAHFIPPKDATVVARMRGAGAILLGKTNVPEFAIYPESDNSVYGRTNNPYDLSRTPGGSSGGEAAIIASEGSPLGLGSDSGGSIRIPAHFCGIAGLKPTVGRVPSTGHFPPIFGLSRPLWQIGPMSRFVEDLGTCLSIIAGEDLEDPSALPALANLQEPLDLKTLRVGFHTGNDVCPATPETAETVRGVARTLSDHGARVDEAAPQGLVASWEIGHELWMADGVRRINTLLKEAGTSEPHPLLQKLLDLAQAGPAAGSDMGDLIARWDSLKIMMLSFFKEYDVIVCPVCAYPALPHGTTLDSDNLPAFSYTAVYNLTGWPAAVVRAGATSDGLPIGVQIVASPWRDDVALGVAQYIETALGGWQRPPL
jgi:amidase